MTTKNRRPLPSAYTFSGKLGTLSGLAVLEQKMYASRDLKVCIECDEPGIYRQESVLIKSCSHYWFCGECDFYWNRGGKDA